MELRKAIRLGSHQSIALVGAGGKSSALFRLANELNPPVILTASTHLAIEQIELADSHHIVSSVDEVWGLEEELLKGRIIVTGQIDGDRTNGLSVERLTELGVFCREHKLPLIIEADGSRCRPIKAPAAHEPAIPHFIDTVVVVAGLSALGKPLSSKWVHRPEIFSRLSGLNVGDVITHQAINRVLNHPSGGLKSIPPIARRVILLNQADTRELIAIAGKMVKTLLDPYDAVVISGYQKEQEDNNRVEEMGFQIRRPFNTVHSASEIVAGIVLAGGEGKRFGQPKQLLDWKGKPFVWHSAKIALDAGLQPVVVVTGAYRQEVERAIAELPVQLVNNPTWHLGQGTSVSTGVKTLSTSVGAAIFLLADQPHIPQSLIKVLISAHAKTMSGIVVPFVGLQQANPVLFDRDLFLELSTLEGDIGGRKLFDKGDVFKVKWDDPEILLDIDTPDDYERLLSLARKSQ